MEQILIKSVGLLSKEFMHSELKCCDAVVESLTAVNSVCLTWWSVLTGRAMNKRRLRHLLDSKSVIVLMTLRIYQFTLLLIKKLNFLNCKFSSLIS